jgi:hypothetical protein
VLLVIAARDQEQLLLVVEQVNAAREVTQLPLELMLVNVVKDVARLLLEVILPLIANRQTLSLSVLMLPGLIILG